MNPSSTSSTINELAAISSSVSASVSRWFSSTFSDPSPSPSPRPSPTSSTFTSPAFSTRSIVSDTSSAPSPTAFRPRAPNMAPCPPELYAMFPTIQVDLIQAVYLETGGDVDATVPRLLEMTDPDFAMRPRTPSPPPRARTQPQPQPARHRTTEQSRDFLAAHYAAFTPGVAMSGMMRSDIPTSSLGPITVQSLWDDAVNGDDNDDDEDRPFLPDIDIDITQMAAKTKTLLRDVATKLERFGSKVADEIEIALGDAPLAQAQTTTTSSRNSFALSLQDDDDASIVTLASMNPLHSGSRSSSPAPSPRVSPFAARAGAAPTGLTITTTRNMHGHRRTNSASSTASSIHSSAPPSPFVVSEAGDSDDDLDLDLDAAIVPVASSSVSRSPPRASASSPTGPARTGSWPIPAARRLGSASSVSAQRPSSPLAGSVLSTSPIHHVEEPTFKAKGKTKATVPAAEAPVLIEE